nr:natural killer cells antigen CD94-like [Dasypus novemcinctus]
MRLNQIWQSSPERQLLFHMAREILKRSKRFVGLIIAGILGLTGVIVTATIAITALHEMNILEASKRTASSVSHTYVAHHFQLNSDVKFRSSVAIIELFCINFGTSFLMAAFQTSPWNLISGILGAMCFLLMATLGILLNYSYTKQNLLSTLSSGPTSEAQEGSDCCSCQEKWIGYRCNCYFFSTEEKPWEESRDACASQNSTLLQLENRDELGFVNSLQYYYWIGLSYSDVHGAWLWENGSTLSSDLFSFSLTPNSENCVLYKSRRDVLDENCFKNNRYICKQGLI